MICTTHTLLNKYLKEKWACLLFFRSSKLLTLSIAALLIEKKSSIKCIYNLFFGVQVGLEWMLGILILLFGNLSFICRHLAWFSLMRPTTNVMSVLQQEKKHDESMQKVTSIEWVSEVRLGRMEILFLNPLEKWSFLLNRTVPYYLAAHFHQKTHLIAPSIQSMKCASVFLNVMRRRIIQSENIINIDFDFISRDYWMIWRNVFLRSTTVGQKRFEWKCKRAESWKVA